MAVLVLLVLAGCVTLSSEESFNQVADAAQVRLGKHISWDTGQYEGIYRGWPPLVGIDPICLLPPAPLRRLGSLTPDSFRARRKPLTAESGQIRTFSGAAIFLTLPLSLRLCRSE